jgi:hypothetical protein
MLRKERLESFLGRRLNHAVGTYGENRTFGFVSQWRWGIRGSGPFRIA